MMEGYTILSLLLCLSVPSALANDVVRLVGGSSTTQGRVEVYYDGSWGTVCNRYWELEDANIVCRQLGFPGAIRQITNAQVFGAGSGLVHLDGVECDGYEASIMDCPRSAFGSVCNHDQDAGVMCLTNSFRVREEEDFDFYQREDMMEEEKKEKAAAYEGSDAKKDADLMKKDILQALYDLLAELKHK
ncbi:neurotrypsin-like [Strongylocentrotus purpuratus]|uniref:SRCR domain-containing protein n=1 Tax=Strongylocentrotus purpuratus TaxID=7668 RepID=A0A7M7P6C8_STRPU|nr:neurotrypsin-like [Strongylocentrotus purpuratus]|eukprot:XP_011679035.1 PREDICTED: neurotrypsin isoform X1 [Strongylocentrotus purpuratus]